MKLNIEDLNENDINEDLLDLLRKYRAKGLKVNITVTEENSIKKGKPSREQLANISKRNASNMKTKEWENIVNDL